jgi:hypothetical protein
MLNKRLIFLGVFQTITALGAIPAGLSLIFQPDGSGLGLPLQILTDSPFENFFIPGIFLFFVNGLCNVLGSFLSFRKSTIAGMVGLILAILLILWICIQVLITGLIHFLQPTFFGIGMVELILSYVILSKRKPRPGT